MSGTSRDGVDVGLVRIRGRYPRNRFEEIAARTGRYPAPLRRLLHRAPEGITVEETAGLDFLLAEIFAREVLALLEEADMAPGEVDAVGSHGQTLVHLPGGVRVADRRTRATMQIGSGAVLAHLTEIPTVTDFRSADVARGGEGAPLVPAYDYAALRSEHRGRVALNIGGMANLTAIPAGGRPEEIVSFDTGPGNSVIDSAVRILKPRRDFDRDGRMARAGTADKGHMEAILGHPYFRRKPPKSTGWEDFGRYYTSTLVGRMQRKDLSPEDIVRTLTESVAESIARSIREFVVPRMEVHDLCVTGGGSRNPVLLDSLRRRLPALDVERGEAFGLSTDHKEAFAFGYLAYLHIKRIPANLASQAAGLRPAILGTLHPV
jgi:anhydro-N-acetylmuramic acid kinase